MKVFFDVKSNIQKKVNKLLGETLAAQVRAVQKGTLLIHEIAVKSIQENNDGRSEIRYNPKRTVNVSDEGDTPNTDTGRLVQSIKFDFKNEGLTGRVGTNLKYGAWLEFGTKTMQARPWLTPAVQLAGESIGEIFAGEIQNALKKVGE